MFDGGAVDNLIESALAQRLVEDVRLNVRHGFVRVFERRWKAIERDDLVAPLGRRKREKTHIGAEIKRSARTDGEPRHRE